MYEEYMYLVDHNKDILFNKKIWCTMISDYMYKNYETLLLIKLLSVIIS